MPGLGLFMAPALEQEQRQEQRLEQNLVQTLQLSQMQRLLQLTSEEKYGKYGEVLRKIKNDLDDNVYYDVDEFHYRVGKRIKKSKRNNESNELVETIRELIDKTKEQKKSIDLNTIKNVIDLGIVESAHIYNPINTYKSLTKISSKLTNSLDDIVSLGEFVSEPTVSASSVYKIMNSFEKYSKLETKTQEIFDFIFAEKEKDFFNTQIAIAQLGYFNKNIPKANRKTVELFYKLIGEIKDVVIRGDLSYLAMPSEMLFNLDNEKLEKYSSIPLPVFAQLLSFSHDEKTLTRMNEFGANKHMRNSKDNKRAFYNSLTKMKLLGKGNSSGVPKDIILKANGMKQARDLLLMYSNLSVIRPITYDFDLKNGDEIKAHLKDTSLGKEPIALGMSKEAREIFYQEVYGDKLNFKARIYSPLITFSRIYNGKDKNLMPILSKILESVVFGNFKEYRYADDVVEEQLKLEPKGVEVWKENYSKKRLIGDAKGIKPALNSANSTIKQLTNWYFKKYDVNDIYQHIRELRNEQQNLVNNPEISSIDKVGPYRTVYIKLTQAQTIARLQKLNEENFHELQVKIAGSLIEGVEDEYRTDITNLSIIGMNTADKALKPLLVEETDDVCDLLDVGLTPVKSCQRWNEKTSYNYCLPAYIVDPNKKIVRVYDRFGSTRMRNVVRLIHTEQYSDEPTIFIERAYSDISTPEMFKAVAAYGFEKAVQLSNAIGNSVGLATKDDNLAKELEKIASELKIDYETNTKLNVKFAKSRNSHEYSDAFGGTIKSGAKVSSSYIFYTSILPE